MTWILPLVLACFGDPPIVAEVSPAAAWPGDTVVVRGEGFEAGTLATLVLAERRVPLPLAVLDPTLLQAELPEDLPPGPWRLEVSGDGGLAEAQPVVDVWTADSEPACTKRYALDVDTSRTLRRVVIERHFEGRSSTRKVLLGDQLTALAWERRPLDDGRTCSALWLLDSTGHRWLIADDADRDLAHVGAQLATALAVPLAPLDGGATGATAN